MCGTAFSAQKWLAALFGRPVAGSGPVSYTHLVAVADIRPEAARETAQRYEIPAWYDDPQKMLDEVKPDWVSVCTPNRRHNLSILALRAGANVMCEKPLALTWREAKEMLSLIHICKSQAKTKAL